MSNLQSICEQELEALTAERSTMQRDLDSLLLCGAMASHLSTMTC